MEAYKTESLWLVVPVMRENRARLIAITRALLNELSEFGRATLIKVRITEANSLRRGVYTQRKKRHKHRRSRLASAPPFPSFSFFPRLIFYG